MPEHKIINPQNNKCGPDMPIVERDAWRLQYFKDVECPAEVNIPTDDPDCWQWYPETRWIYDRLRIAQSQGLKCAPHGVMPDEFPVFSKPIINLKGMGVGSRLIKSDAEMKRHSQPGHMWMANLEGEHISTDCAVSGGRILWLRHARGIPSDAGTFDYWIICARQDEALVAYLGDWIASNIPDYFGMMNFETIGGRIIEAHLRFADQWCDLYGKHWLAALVQLYQNGSWDTGVEAPADGYSLPLFAHHGQRLRHPPLALQNQIRSMPGIASLQITFDETIDHAQHAMPPGGFRLAVMNAWDFAAGSKARNLLANHYREQVSLLEFSGAEHRHGGDNLPVRRRA